MKTIYFKCKYFKFSDIENYIGIYRRIATDEKLLILFKKIFNYDLDPLKLYLPLPMTPFYVQEKIMCLMKKSTGGFI